MTRPLHLTITTPVQGLVDDRAVAALRAEDESGSFGILPGHVDLLTALPASVVRWRGSDGGLHFCAIRAGLMTVRGGHRIEIACREGVAGDDLHGLEDEVAQFRAGQTDADRRARVEQMRLHANAVRQIMRLLRPGRTGGLEHPRAMSPRTGTRPP